MRSGRHRWSAVFCVCLGFYLIPCIVTLFIRKNIPEDDVKTFDSGIFVYISQGDYVQEMDMEEYLVGVVAAQIPADYPLEALKTQAVIARTYIMNVVGDRKAVEATELNQEYCSMDVLREKYGSDFEEVRQKLVRAVCDTTEEVITYEDRQVTPVFFRCSNGKTRNAADVWGSDIPYLVSVDSSADTECEDASTQVTLSVEECIQKLKAKYSDFEAQAEGFKDTVQILQKDGAGYVTKIQMGNMEFLGEELRYIFSLPSASFEVRAKSRVITFTVTGIGHGVGLSQWGAKAMAEEGQGYLDILAWYFPGTAVK